MARVSLSWVDLLETERLYSAEMNIISDFEKERKIM